MKSSHMLLCAVLLVVGVVLLTTGVGAIAFLPFVACMLMMGAMMWFMMRPRGRRPLAAHQTHSETHQSPTRVGRAHERARRP